MADRDPQVLEFLARRAAAYIDRKPIYEFLRDSLEGGRRWVDRYVFRQSPRETQADFDRRKQQAVYPNLVASVLSIYRDHVFKRGEGIRRDIPVEAYVEWVRDVDRGGRDANEFWGSVGVREMLYGWCGVLVDMPSLPEIGRPVTRADQPTLGLTPYLVAVTPLEVADWSVGADGRLNWVHLIATACDDAAPYTRRTERLIHTIYHRGGWERWDDRGNQIAGGEYDLEGDVPFVVVRYNRSDVYDWIGRSFMEDFAMLNRALANSISLRHDFLAKNALQILTLQMQAMVDDDQPAEAVIRNLLEYAGDRPPQFIGPDVAGAEWMFAHAQDLLLWMRLLAQLQDIDITTVAQSGVAKMIDFERTNAALTAFADSLEAAELEATRLWFRWQGIDWDDQWIIDYPDTFAVRALTDEIAIALQVRDLYGTLSPTVVATHLGEVADRLIEDVTPEQRERIDAELIENAGNAVEESVFGGRVRRERLAGERDEEPEAII